MRTFDMTPLFRSTVGFDRMARMIDTLANQQVPSYPPYNIEKIDDDNYRITMAVAGFAENELDVTVQDNQLVITGGKTEAEEEGRNYLYRGIAERSFERRFNLAEHIKIVGANLVNGLLHVELARQVPEEKKPRKVAIGTTAAITQDRQAA